MAPLRRAGGGVPIAETTVSVLWMGCTEWLDRPETWEYIPAFVDPNADGVLDVVSRADEALKKLVDPTCSFNSYQSCDGRKVADHVKAVFNCLRDKPYEMRYIAPPPIPVYVPGDQFASGQRVRRVDEVVTRCRGTCHDLSVLFASCLEQIQIYPLILLITGHTFFGFWKDAAAHSGFWKPARDKPLRRPSDPGRGWAITDPAEIQDLLNRDVITLVDAVRVTDRNATFERAVEAGFKYFNDITIGASSARFDVAVDIQAPRRNVQPL
jgi:hypothetical protein